MAREYVISAAGITLANQPVSLIFINPGTTVALEILRMWIGQSANATSAQQRVQVARQPTSFPTLTSFTPAKLKQNDPVSQITGATNGAAGTCGINASAEGAGSKSVVFEDAFNVLNGWLWVPTPNETIIMAPAATSGLSLFLPVAAATLTNWAFGMVFRELG